MAKGNCVQVALAAAFLSGGMACKPKPVEPVSESLAPAAAAPAPSPAAVAPIEELEGELRLQREPVRSERARRLMALVVPLERHSMMWCSSTLIRDEVLLTAAHCVAMPDDQMTNGGGHMVAAGIKLDSNMMACQHGNQSSCDVPFPTGSFAYIPQDLATIYLSRAQPMSELPRLGSIDGDLPEVYMLSARLGHARAVCRASAASDVVASTDPIEPTDSGSALMAIDGDDAAWILGVVSHREAASSSLVAARLPEHLPWLPGWSTTAPRIEGVSRDDFLRIEECR